MAIRTGGSHVLALCGSTPLRRRSDPTVVGTETDEDGLIPIALPGQLADVELTSIPHRRGACITDM